MFDAFAICDHNFNKYAADMICRESGWDFAIKYSANNPYQENTHQIYSINHLVCPKHASELEDCEYDFHVKSCADDIVKIECRKYFFY